MVDGTVVQGSGTLELPAKAWVGLQHEFYCMLSYNDC